MSKDNVKNVWSLIDSIKVGILQTIKDNKICSRPMHNIQDDFNGSIWFFTDVDSSKSDEIINNQSVSINYADAGKGNFVHLSGNAYIVEDSALIDKFWNRYVSLWFPEGKESERIALIQVDINFIEYWESHSMLSKVYEVIKAKIKNEQPNLGDNEIIKLQ